jgi:DNA-binding MurR/RpiR family transcriptional regulator
MASTKVLDGSETGWTKNLYSPTLAQMSLSELLYHALARERPDALDSLEKPENHY